MMKNPFYFTLKALFVLKLFKFSCLLFGRVKKRFAEEDKVYFKIYDFMIWLTITIHILLNISRFKGEQVIKFSQIIEYNKRNVYSSKNHAENVARSLVPNLFLFVKKALHEVKSSVLQFSLNIFR